MDERQSVTLLKLRQEPFIMAVIHTSTKFAEQGKRFDIDVAFLAFGENPIGIQDKMTLPTSCVLPNVSIQEW